MLKQVVGRGQHRPGTNFRPSHVSPVGEVGGLAEGLPSERLSELDLKSAGFGPEVSGLGFAG